MNMVEKILARKSGQKSVAPGEVVLADIDLMLMHDLSANFVMKVFENEMEGASIADPSKLVFAFDHNFAPATRDAAEALAAVRRFAAKHKVKNLFDSGCGSIHHVVMEAGLVTPGMIVIGCDSHTPIYGALGAFGTGVGNNSMAALGFTQNKGWFKVPETIKIHFHGTPMKAVQPRDISQFLVGKLGEDGAIYKALEYAGPYIESLDVNDRALFPLQAIDVGGKCGFVNPDDKTLRHVRQLFANKPGVPQFETLPERRRLSLRGYRRYRCQSDRAAGGVSADGRQCAPHRRRGGHSDQRRGGGRKHGRKVERHPHAGPLLRQSAGSPGRAPASRAGLARHLSRCAQGRFVRDAAYRGREHLPAQRRLQPGVQHGRAGGGRGHDLDTGP